MKVFWTKESLQRLREIELYISRDNSIAAEKFIDKLVELAETLTTNSRRGRVVPEFSIPEVRELLFRNYRIVYIIKKSRIDILTVFERHQLIKKERII
ncbi:MAG: type II toxin-antitoxin system RelE/ParE family toxin [Ignavibacteriaceae bacterium]|nr:type II toxin-antitoxin system RelE/ParE family toxin [Ignavibacteriaceae bacterium]